MTQEIKFGSGFLLADDDGTLHTDATIAGDINVNTDELEDRTGAKTETAPATDTASSGLNGRLQRIAQRLTTIIAGISLLAGEAHVGEIGGYKRSSSIEFTRPSDTTAYAALDVIAPATLSVTDATNASPIVITTAAHSLSDGDAVTIASVGGNTNANGNFYVKVTGYSSTTFALYSDAALATPVAGNANYTSGGTAIRIFKLNSMARVAGQNGYVVKGQLYTDQKTCVARVRVHLFSTPPTAIADNSPYLKLWANRTIRTGEIAFPALSTEDATNSTAASSIVTGNTSGSNLPMYFGTVSPSTGLYPLFETLDAFTPASGQNFYLRFGNEDD